MRPPQRAHSTASSHELKRAVWPGGGASDGSAGAAVSPPFAYRSASRAFTSGERIPASSCCSGVRNRLPNQRKM